MARYEVLVIGAGVTGLATALRLEERRILNIALSSSKNPDAGTRRAAGLLPRAYVDNFTRFSHVFGEAGAGELWRLAARAHQSLLDFCGGRGVSVARNRHFRLLVGADELKEAGIAVGQLHGQGFDARLLDGLPELQLGKGVLGVQIDDAGEGGGIVLSVDELVSALEAAIAAPTLPAVKSMKTSANGVLVEHVDGTKSEAEIVVLAKHLGIGELVPELKDALVPIADQWGRYAIDRFDGDAALAGTVFSARHGHDWGAFVRPGEIILGGARYMRKWAGIEAETATVEPKVTKRLAEFAAASFPAVGTPRLIEAVPFRDVRPCDELPIIGPMFGEGRIVVATGFLGSGLTVGFFAGECLAELIVTGGSTYLPRRLWPERLRSLSDG